MVNYALLYGKTAFSLAKDIGVSRKEAERFIEAYFARYPKVRAFIDETIVKARETGHVRTLLGRLRRLPDLRAKSFPVRMEAERQAMNTPGAGLGRRPHQAGHDRPAPRVSPRGGCAPGSSCRSTTSCCSRCRRPRPRRPASCVTEVMEGALKLDVPLVADARLGRSWAEVH